MNYYKTSHMKWLTPYIYILSQFSNQCKFVAIIWQNYTKK